MASSYIGRQYRPLQGDVSSDIINHENQMFKHRAEERLEEDRKNKAIADKQKKAKEGLARAKALKMFDTGSGTLNETMAEALTIATNEYPKIFEVLDDNTGKYSQQDKIKAKLKLDNIYNLPDNLKLLANGVMREYQEYQKGVQSGALWRDENYESKFQNGFEGVSLSFDDSGMPVAIFRNGNKDVNGDGIIDANDVETMSSLNDIYSRPSFTKKYDFESVVQKHAENLIARVDTDVNGFKTTTTTGVDPKLLDKTINRALYVNGKPSDLMKSFVKERGLDINSESDLKTIENAYKEEVLLRTESGVEEKFNASAYVSNKKENRIAQENNSESSLGESVTPTKQTYGIYHNNIDTNKVNSVNVTGEAVIPALKTEKGETISNLTPHNITRDKYGRMVVEGSYQETKTQTMTTSAYDEAIKEATEKGDNTKLYALNQAKESEGGMRVTLPGKNKRKDITVSKEDETLIASKLGMTVEEIDGKVYKEKPTEKDNTPVYKGLDEEGNPIFE